MISTTALRFLATNRLRVLALSTLGFLGPAASLPAASTANTADVVAAANAFLATLSASQKTAIDATTSNTNTSCLYNFALSNAEVWSNLPVDGTTRNGLQFASLSSDQRTLVLAIATAALSDSGTTLLEEIRLADKYISGEVTNSLGTTSSMWGYNKYYIAFVGTPSTSAAWTLQIGGHHMAYNVTYNGPQNSATPMFAATEPNSFVIAGTTYKPLGTQRTLIESLRGSLSTSALLSGSFSDVVFGPNGSGNHDTIQPKSYPASGRGQLYTTLTSSQQADVRSYIESWVAKFDASIADALLADYLSAAALAETYVGYAGSSTTLASSGSYFRVDGPRVWIEFVVQGGVYNASSIHDHACFRDKLADYGAAYGSTTVATTITRPAITTQPPTATVSTGNAFTLSVVASGSGTLGYQWYKDGATLSGATSATYMDSAAAATDAGSYTVTVTNSAGVVTSSAAIITVQSASNTAPAIATPPATFHVPVGYAATFSVVASGTAPLAFQWSKNGVALSGANAPTLTFASAALTDAGAYTVVVSNSYGSVTSSAASLVVGSGAGRVPAISMRARVGTGSEILVPGLVVGGSANQQFLIRALGPKLADFGFSSATYLADPLLKITTLDGTVVTQNDNWSTGADAATIATLGASLGAQALTSGSKDAVLLATLAPGIYTPQISGVGDTTGVALVEFYNVDAANIVPAVSMRARVGTGSEILVPGLVVEGTTPKMFLIRALGPKLADFGLASSTYLADPLLKITTLDGTVVAQNDNWSDNANAALLPSLATTLGAQPLTAGSKDAVLLVALPAGTYTPQISGVGGTSGVALVEFYNVE